MFRLVGAPGIEPGSHAPHACIIAFIRHPGNKNKYQIDIYFFLFCFLLEIPFSVSALKFLFKDFKQRVQIFILLPDIFFVCKLIYCRLLVATFE